MADYSDAYRNNYGSCDECGSEYTFGYYGLQKWHTPWCSESKSEFAGTSKAFYIDNKFANMFPVFTRMPKTWECDKCGSVVFDREKHIKFHKMPLY